LRRFEASERVARRSRASFWWPRVAANLRDLSRQKPGLWTSERQSFFEVLPRSDLRFAMLDKRKSQQQGTLGADEPLRIFLSSKAFRLTVEKSVDHHGGS
jgi:hypothetical protein